MPEPDVVEGLSENEIEALAAWMVERETRQYYSGGHLPWGPTQQAIPSQTVPTALRAMTRQQKRAKAAEALAMIDPQTLSEIAPGAYMFRQIIEQVSSLPSAQPEVPEALSEQWGIAPTQPPAPAMPPPSRQLGPSASAMPFGPSAPTRMMGGEPKWWEQQAEPKQPAGFTPPPELAGVTGTQRRIFALQQMANMTANGEDQVFDETSGEYVPSPVYKFWQHQAAIGELEESLGGVGAGGMTAYQSAQLGIQQQQLENERERIRQAMIGLGITGAGAIGGLMQQGSNLAKEAGLYSLPKGAQYARGFEPGGIMASIHEGLGVPYTPQPAARTPVNPYAGAEKAAPMIQEYLRQLGLGG